VTKSSRAVYCFDGDGAVIMHMGSLAVIGTHGPSNFKHIVFNNGAHDSVGGQPTVGHSIDIPAVATACGYRDVFKAVTQEEIKVGIDQLVKAQGPAMLEIKIKKGARKSLGRPPHSLVDAKKMFMKAVN